MALVDARSIVAAARTAGVGESSIRRWLRDDEGFQTKLRQLREEALSHASLRLQHGASRAVEAMLNLIESKDRIEVGRASLVRVREQLSSNRITKQSQFLITPFVAVTYRVFRGLVASFDLGW